MNYWARRIAPADSVKGLNKIIGKNEGQEVKNSETDLESLLKRRIVFESERKLDNIQSSLREVAKQTAMKEFRFSMIGG